MSRSDGARREYPINEELGRQLNRRYKRRIPIFIILMIIWAVFYNDAIYPLYPEGSFMQNELLAMLICFVLPFIIWTAYTARFFRRPLRYLDELTQASESMLLHRDEPVRLSAPLKNAEDRMNEIREAALRGERYAAMQEQRKNDLIMYLAHDLKTPLTSVTGYLQLLSEDPGLTAEQRAKYTGIALDKARRLEDLINEFFDITRLSLTAIRLDLQPRSLSLMLEQFVSESTPVLAEQGLEWQAGIEPDVVFCFDADKMERVFENLLRNAVSYAGSGTSIGLAMKKEGDEALVRMSNRGDIPKDKLEHLFEQFYRIDESRGTGSGGAGLGLAVSREIVEAHGGTINADSRGGMVIFTIRLPMRAEG
ncbi:MAG: sensor histidine kinase [Anaerovoracaceae bacterium]